MPEWLRKIMGSSKHAPMKFAADVAIQAAEKPEGDEEPKRPTFAIHAYTGAPMRVAGYYTPVIIDLAGIKASRATLPILLNHDPDRVIGQADKVEIGEDGIKLSGSITAEDDDAKRVTTNAKNGFRWQASVGANPTRVERLEPGKTTTVNGRTVTGPLLIAREAELYETSFVAVGADQNTTAAVAAQSTGDTDMEFNAWLAARKIDTTGMADETVAALRAAYDAEQSKPATTTDDDGIAALRASRAAEIGRMANIDKVCAGHPDIAARAVAEGWDINRAEVEVLRAARPSTKAPGRTTVENEGEILAASMAMRGGVSQATVAENVPSAIREQVMNHAVSAQFRKAGIHRLMDMSIRAAGRHYDGERTDSAFIRAAFEADRINASGFSTISVAGILSNVAHKSLIDGYNSVNATWDKISAVRSHTNFKAHYRYRLDSQGGLQPLGPDGQIKHVQVSEASYTNRVATEAAMIALTRQMIIDDDLGAFLELPRMLGRMANIRVEEAVYKLLLSNVGTFFAVANQNYKAGTATALGIDGLTAGETLFDNLVDSNGKPILVTPSVLLVPNALKVTARNLMNSTMLIDGTGTAAQPANNPHVGKYTVVNSGYLDNTKITDSNGSALSGQSAKAWYLFANPADRAAIGVAFLNGQRLPMIESADTDFNTLGIQWRVVTDFGVAFEETTSAVKLKGEN